MSDIRAVTGSVSRTRNTSDNNFANLQMSRDGALYTMDWLTSMMFEGRCVVASAGTESTPLTSVSYDQDQPELTIAVASGTSIYVYYHEVAFDVWTGTDNEVICWTTENEIGAGTSTAITDMDLIVPNLDTVGTSAITARVLHTANVTLTNYTEVWRQVASTAEGAGSTPPIGFTWPKFGAPGILLHGPATFGMQISATTTAAQFFSKTHFVILPTSGYN